MWMVSMIQFWTFSGCKASECLCGRLGLGKSGCGEREWLGLVFSIWALWEW